MSRTVTIDLSKEKDTGFIGAIGELVAWKYLSRHKGLVCLSFRGDAKAFAGIFDVDYALARRKLSKKQAKYLHQMLRGVNSSERTYDFICPLSGESCYRYLVEVKTTRHGRLHGTRKKPDEIMKAKSLGFIPLLVHVEFLPNWKFKVTCKEL